MADTNNWGGRREGAGRPRKYRYIKMQFDSQKNAYVGVLPNGDQIEVDADVYAEQVQQGVSEQDLSSPLVWENNQDGESVRIVKR